MKQKFEYAAIKTGTDVAPAPDMPWDGQPDPKFTAMDARFECELLERWRHQRDTAARDLLVRAYMPMTATAANITHAKYLNRDERRAAAMDALAGILHKMPEKGFGCHGSLVTLHQYMRLRMSQEITSENQKQRKHHTMRREKEDGDDVPDTRKAEWSHIAARREIEFLIPQAKLNTMQQQIVGGLMDGASQTEIAHNLDLGESTVSRNRKIALEKLGVAAAKLEK
jgi:DNA-directed RNA polymerase specialized sigma subunit